MDKHDLKLVSYELCPYVQRSIIILNEKQIPHSKTYIDLNEPPIWFNEKSPLGKVPLLIVDDKHVLFESSVICEYLDEITPGSLLPENPMIKASHRAWIEFGSQILNDIGTLYSCKEESAFANQSDILKQKINRLENEILFPFYSGSDFMMIDAVYATIFRYFDVIESYLKINIFEKCNKVMQWRATLSNHESVINGVKHNYQQKLHIFLRNRKSFLSSIIGQ